MAIYRIVYVFAGQQEFLADYSITTENPDVAQDFLSSVQPAYPAVTLGLLTVSEDAAEAHGTLPALLEE